MNIRIETLAGNLQEEYEVLLYSVETALLYSSLHYRDFLQRILQNSAPHYLLAYEGERLVGALPSFLCQNPTYGNVLNSLPFFGSNGGLILSHTLDNSSLVKQALLAAFIDLATSKKVTVSALISNPLAADQAFYEEHTRYAYRDERIGQITSLPVGWRNSEELREKLVSLCHPMRRRNLQKAKSSGLTIYHSDSLETMQQLFVLHQENMRAIGGLAKPWAVFAAIRDSFTYDREYRVYVAAKDGRVIAALLIFYYNRTAEYFIPATAEEYRVYQPASLLIFEAMQEAARRGCAWWNWGGTWHNQKGVYDFKRRWGAVDLPYYYYVTLYQDPIPMKSLGKSGILDTYPYFYVLPFGELDQT